MTIELLDYRFSLAEKTISGRLVFPSDREIQILSLGVLQMVQKKYQIGGCEVLSAVGEGAVRFDFGLKPRVISIQLGELLEKKLKRMQGFYGEDVSLYELEVSFMKGKSAHICLLPLQISY